jgi:hypothetical protein
VNLVGGKNEEGYFHALSKTWDIESDLTKMPAKSALSQKRGRVSFEFFKEQTDGVVKEFEPHRRTWRGLHVYATDGDQYELPRTEDILEQGYRGYPCAGDMETHYPHMYVVHCYDVLGGVTKEFRYSGKNEEMHHAMEIAVGLEEKSLTLYDRLFFCKDLIRSHQGSGSFFVARLKEGGLVLPEIIEFAESSKRNACFVFEGTLIHLIKVVNPKTGEAALFATNLPRSRFRNKEIADLYALRWEVETANRDMSHTIKVEQWHSRFFNGILQELYTALWLMNQARVQMAVALKKQCRLETLFDYSKSNFKLIVDFILDNLEDLAHRRYRRILRRLKFLLRTSVEHRERRSRSYPRQVKKSRKIYPSASTVPRQK